MSYFASAGNKKLYFLCISLFSNSLAVNIKTHLTHINSDISWIVFVVITRVMMQQKVIFSEVVCE